MWALAKYLERNPHIPRAMRHLFVSERSQSQAYEDWKPPEASDHSACLDGDKHEAAALRRVMSRIFPLIAPFIETLCYLCFQRESDERIRYLHSIYWPRLAELTVRGEINLSLPSSYPSLERLHLYISYLSNEPSPEIIHVHRGQGFNGSRLTYLKISGFDYDAFHLLTKLKEAWGVGSDNPQFPSELRCIILQPQTLPNAWEVPGGVLHGNDTGMWARWQAEGLCEIVLQKGLESWVYYDRAKSDWLERLNGGKGCWIWGNGGIAEAIEESK